VSTPYRAAAPPVPGSPSPGAEASRARTLAEQYAQMAHAYEPRPTDAVLRTLDLVISGTALVVLSPLLALVSLAILLTSGRPVLYRGSRVGRFGYVFEMYKFRTLAPDAETRLGPYLGKELTLRTVTEEISIARPLRAAHLDEIPQLWNVLRGDMSIVGPRPVRPAFFLELCERVPQYWQRLVVRPGVTGFAQTRITREETWEDKIAHDLEYIADRSVSLYLRVLVATGRRILREVASGLGRLTGRGRDERR
jgi:lipopolysaccharide/colanic/teichoic acid biosynthesis glycosyltransferase